MWMQGPSLVVCLAYHFTGPVLDLYAGLSLFRVRPTVRLLRVIVSVFELGQFPPLPHWGVVCWLIWM